MTRLQNFENAIYTECIDIQRMNEAINAEISWIRNNTKARYSKHAWINWRLENIVLADSVVFYLVSDAIYDLMSQSTYANNF
jgi:hypothetical protein